MTRTIIASSHTITDPLVVWKATANSPIDITQVISGGARGIDFLGEQWAKENGVPLKVCPAEGVSR